MTKVLVIDDVRLFKFDGYVDVDVTYARTAAEAISVLESDWTWDMVWFDHDLGGEFGKFDTYDTIMPVITWLEENIYFGNKPSFGEVVIHTANPSGRKVLDAVLSRHYKVTHVDALDYVRGQLPNRS